eukprot:jgi/Picsp_1/4415/NSC_06637-R1_sam-dependent methyltransferase protein
MAFLRRLPGYKANLIKWSVCPLALVVIIFTSSRKIAASRDFSGINDGKVSYTSAEFLQINEDMNPYSVARNILCSSSPGIFVDVGSNTGGFVGVGRGCRRRSIAAEPDPRNWKILESNFPEVQIYKGGISDRRGSQKFFFHSNRTDWSCATCLGEAAPGVFPQEVQIEKLDNLVKEPLLLLKTDTQGYEFKVLKGAQTLISKSLVPFILLEFDTGLLRRVSNNEAWHLLSFVHESGFRCVQLELSRHPKTSDQSNNNNLHMLAKESLREGNIQEFLKHRIAMEPDWTDLLCSLTKNESYITDYQIRY